ncbi:MAG: response regulator [Firmicutes bacterium]|nr:response regulator [Bacillota bacterium]
MKIICVDDEKLILELIVSMCKAIRPTDEISGFNRPEKALEWCEDNRPDVVLLDIRMPKISGIELAAKIKQKHPKTAVIFMTGYSEYALEAYCVHPSGYLLKPPEKEKLAAEITYALQGKKDKDEEEYPHIRIKAFDVFADGELVKFERTKAKELLAYLVDQNGAGVSRKKAFVTLWDNENYDRSGQKHLDVIIRSLRDTLKQYGIDDMFELQNGIMRIFPEKIDCDYYRFLKGEPKAVNSYRGKYMESYSWASLTEGKNTMSN